MAVILSPMPLPRFTVEKSALLVVDVQEKLLPSIHEHEAITRQCVKLIRGCAALNVPVIVTEQYSKGLCSTVGPIREVLPGDAPVFEKMKFSAYVEGVRKKISELQRTHVILCGIETHICVMQTALDLADAGLIVGVATDAVGSRTPADREAGLRRMASIGVVPLSVEMALFEMVHEAGTDRFKAVLPIVK